MSQRPRRQRLTDKQAAAVLAGYYIFRNITTRVGLAFLPWLLANAVWALPLLRNDRLAVISAGSSAHDEAGLLAAIASASVLQSTVAGLVIYWAGHRFGPKLAELGSRKGTVWSGIWNPKQVARAHAWLERRGIFAVGLSRGLGVLVVPVALVAGSSDMTFRKFFAAYQAGSVVWTASMVWLGVQAGTRWPWIPDKIKSFANLSWKIGLVSLALFALVFVFGRKTQQPAAEETP